MVQTVSPVTLTEALSELTACVFINESCWDLPSEEEVKKNGINFAHHEYIANNLR